MFRHFIPGLIILALSGFYGTAYAASPTETVHATVDAVLALLRDKSLDKTTRRAKMRALINERFDFRAMSQRTLATNWRKASDPEKDRFVDLFGQLIENTYIGRIEAYTDEKVEYRDEKLDGKKAVVGTVIKAGNTDIPVDYKLWNKNNAWWVYDVIIEEVSLISSYRSTYQQIVKKDGFPGLFVQMEAKIKELDSQPSPS